MADKIRGTIKDWKKNHRGVFATGGPWRGQDEHRAWASTGMTDARKGDARKNKSGNERLQGGRANASHRHYAVPYGTHGEDGAVQNPRWSLRNPTGDKVANPPRKRRSKAISSR